MSKTKQELFDLQANEYGCGYYKSCWEHACPCNISITCDGIYNEKIDKGLREEGQRVADDLEKEISDADFYEMLYGNEDETEDWDDDDYDPYEDYEDEEEQNYA